MSPHNFLMLHVSAEEADLADIPIKPSEINAVKFKSCQFILTTKQGVEYQADMKTGLWLKSTSRKLFRKYVLFFKKCIVEALKRLRKTRFQSELSKKKTMVQSCVKALDILNEINKHRDLPLPFNCFHLKRLMDYISVVGDLRGYISDKQMGNNSSFRFCKYPFLYNPASKYCLLKLQCATNMKIQKDETQSNLMLLILGLSIINRLSVKRDDPVIGARNLLNKDEFVLQLKLEVVFEGENNYSGDGIRQEFFEVFFEKVFDPDFAVFRNEESSYPWLIKGCNLKDLKLIGLMCGLAVYNGATIGHELPGVIYKKLLKRPVTFEDFKNLKPEFCKFLEQMIVSVEDGFEEKFPDLFFSIELALQNGKIESFELCENGEDIQVTHSNKMDFIHRLIDFHLNTSIEKEFESFCDGFYKGIPENFVTFFQPEELKEILEGEERCDFEALEKVTEYRREYNKNHNTIRLFWEVFHELEVVNKKKILRFVAGGERIPAHGIKRFKMKIAPYVVACGDRNNDHVSTDDLDSGIVDPDHLLIHANTCDKTLLLPLYKSKEVMKQNVLHACDNSRGFGNP